MPIRRRDFLRAGLVAAAYGAAARGWAETSVGQVAGPTASGNQTGQTDPTATGWAQVPGILAQIVPPIFPDRDFPITDYGAASAPADSAPAFAAAIEACNDAGGGRVVIPAGQWLCNGPIRLQSNVNLYSESGASVVFGTDPVDYLPVQLVRWQGVRCYNYSPLIHAHQQTNIAVTGSGVFNGQGYPVWNLWVKKQKADWLLLQQMAQRGVPLEKRVFGDG